MKLGTYTLVLDYLRKNRGGLTVKECGEKIGTTELRKIVSDLRCGGWKIGDLWEKGVNRYGEPTRYKRYFLIGKKKDK